MKNNVLITVLTVAAFNAEAQVYPTAVADNYVTSSSSNKVQHTGADYWQNSNASRTMCVMVSDGSDPSLYWVKNSLFSSEIALANNATINAQAEFGDPDVVINSTGVRALSVFVARNALNETNLYIQRYQRPNQTHSYWSFLGTPVLVVSSSAEAPITCPNADITTAGDVVIVYQCLDTIWATTVNVNTGIFLPLTPVPVSTSFSNQALCRQPDVAVYSPTLAGLETVYITCINDHSGAEEILVHEVTLAQLMLGIGSGSTQNNVYTSATGWLAEPRIATQWTNSNPNAFDNWAVTFTEHDPGNNTYDIIAEVNYYGTVSAPILINNINATDRQSINETPCITYSENTIVIAWTFHDMFSQYGLTGFDILCRKLNWDGSYSTGWINNYSLVNADTYDNQYAPSITDSRLGNSQNGTTLFCWYQHDALINTKIGYRNSLHSATNLRLSNITQATEITVYPNPAQNNVNIHFQSNTKDHIQLLLYTLAGELVVEEQIINRMDETQIHRTLSTSSLSNGIYILEIIQGDRIKTEKLIIQH